MKAGVTNAPPLIFADAKINRETALWVGQEHHCDLGRRVAGGAAPGAAHPATGAAT